MVVVGLVGWVEIYFLGLGRLVLNFRDYFLFVSCCFCVV